MNIVGYTTAQNDIGKFESRGLFHTTDTINLNFGRSTEINKVCYNNLYIFVYNGSVVI